MNNWEKVALSLPPKAFVDLELRMFQCPHCNNLIYEEEWKDSDFVKGKFKRHLYCPLCRAELCVKLA